MKPLPTWREIEARFDKGDHTALDRFIFHNEPADSPEDTLWREQLAEVVVEAARAEQQRIGEAVQALKDSDTSHDHAPAVLTQVIDIIANEQIEE